MNRKAVLVLTLLLLSYVNVAIDPIRSVSAAPVRVYVDPPLLVDPNVLFNVSVRVDNLLDLAGAEWTLTWDPNLLKVVKMTEVMFHEVTPQEEWDNIWRLLHEVDNVVGAANYAYMHLDFTRADNGGYLPIAGNHTMAILTFQVVGTGNCSLHLASVKLANNAWYPASIEHETTDGFFCNAVEPPPLPPGPIEDSQLLFYISPHRVMNESLTVNGTFSVALKMDTIASHRGIIAAEFELQWNSTLLEFVSMTEMMFQAVTPETERGNIVTFYWWDNAIGKVGLLSDHPSNLTQALQKGYLPLFGNHTLAVVTFKVKNIGRCLLHLTFCRAQDVTGATALYSSSDGYFGNMMKGDMNGDDVVDLLDALAFATCFGLSSGYPSWNEEADLNGDGGIDVFDAIQLAACFGNIR
jgi:hypothetical protein